ncbi:MAG: 4-hydroxy-3-methylbut-2-enyl diphosphate reductase [Dehalococcoidia bacterium]|nr:4-hydroxy-3-methylbut-2-enyl diphosphate reductase [Dehalococcoidia bacterium]
MEVLLSSPRGFCAGVDRAIEVVEQCLKRFGEPVYVKHEIVHNPYVVSDLEKKGAITVEEVEKIPPGSVVVFSAHGSPPEDFQKAEALGLKVIDATCPLVTKVHNEARKYAKEGRKVVLVGHRGHQEVRGTMGQTPMTLIDEREGLSLSDWDNDTPVAVLTQTTLSVDDTSDVVDEIRRTFPDAITRADICYATTNRQEAVKELAGKVDMVLVIGAQNSSNCNRLREVAEAHGVPAYLINGPEDLDKEWLADISRVGITSGASTPEVLVDEVIRALQPDKVTSMTGIEENVTFVLPKELRGN